MCWSAGAFFFSFIGQTTAAADDDEFFSPAERNKKKSCSRLSRSFLPHKQSSSQSLRSWRDVDSPRGGRSSERRTPGAQGTSLKRQRRERERIAFNDKQQARANYRKKKEKKNDKEFFAAPPVSSRLASTLEARRARGPGRAYSLTPRERKRGKARPCADNGRPRFLFA